MAPRKFAVGNCFKGQRRSPEAQRLKDELAQQRAAMAEQIYAQSEAVITGTLRDPREKFATEGSVRL